MAATSVSRRNPCSLRNTSPSGDTSTQMRSRHRSAPAEPSAQIPPLVAFTFSQVCDTYRNAPLGRPWRAFLIVSPRTRVVGSSPVELGLVPASCDGTVISYRAHTVHCTLYNFRCTIPHQKFRNSGEFLQFPLLEFMTPTIQYSEDYCEESYCLRPNLDTQDTRNQDTGNQDCDFVEYDLGEISSLPGLLHSPGTWHV
jgi:hypothetical protein